MQIALENFKQAEREGAQNFAPRTYAWAKQKIYVAKKTLIQNPESSPLIEAACLDASAASAQLLSIVRNQKRKDEVSNSQMIEKDDLEAIKNFVNEGGPVS